MIARFRSPAAARRAFTLVELLVSLTIFVILATLTLGAFRGVSKDDQISAASQTVKGWFETARSRAIRNKSAYGLRFIPESNSGRYCTTVSYISAGATDESNLDPNLAAAAQKWIKPVVDATTGILTNRVRAGAASIADWRGFVDSGALPKVGAGNPFGLRIEIPKNSGQWFPLLGITSSGAPPTYFLNLGGGAQSLLAGYVNPGDGSVDDDGDLLPDAYVAQRVEYRLELSPVVEQETATSLPRGIVIDLDASFLPANWRPNATGAAYPVTTTTTLPIQTTMDVLFNKNGSLVANSAPPGSVLHLCVSTFEDAEAARNNFTTGHPQFEPTASARVYPFILRDPKTAQKLVSVFLGSGRISTANVNTDGDSLNNGVQNEFVAGVLAKRYAIRGRESK